jgi:hypothetical protein
VRVSVREASNNLVGERNVASAPDEVTDIQREMARIRVELHQNMEGVVAGAEAATNWHRYVKHYPWAALGVAFVAGYFLVPRKRRSATRTGKAAAREVVEEVRDVIEGTHPKAQAEKPKKKAGILGTAVAFVGPIALRAAQGYAVQYIENWIMQQAAQNPLIGGAAMPSSGSNPSNRPRT